MAVLSKIRQRSALLIAVIGVALLAFVIEGVLSSTGNGASRNIGHVNGQDINTMEFNYKVEQAKNNNQWTNSQAVVAVWNNDVNEILLATEIEKLGLKIGPDQLINVIKNDPSIAGDPNFQDEAGNFSMDKFNSFVLMMKQQGPDQWNAWLNFEAQLEKIGLQQMYFSLIEGGIYATDLDAKTAYLLENDKVSFNYVAVPYSSVNDQEASVSDQEITSYMKQHSNRFHSEPTRVIEYAYIQSLPSQEDKEAVKEALVQLLEPTIAYNVDTKTNDTIAGFRNTKDVALFVNTNSDQKFDTLYYSKSQLPQGFQDQLFNLNVGEVYGPYEIGNSLFITKMVDKQVGNQVDAAHILISYQGAPSSMSALTKEQAKEKADKLLQQIQKDPSLFAGLAALESDDPGSKQNGGLYQGISKGMMVPEFDTYIFSNPIGKVGLIETTFGYHIVKVTDKVNTVQLANLIREIEVSDTTADQIYAQATNLEQSAADNTDFIALAQEQAFTTQSNVIIYPFQDQLPGVGEQSNIVSWAFNSATKQNAIKRFDTALGHIIVKVTTVDNSGLLPMVEARKIVEPILMNQKKAQIIRKTMTGATLDQVASSSNASVQSASNLTLKAPLIPSIGYEATVVGVAFATELNGFSGLIDGQNGVYMIQTTQVNKAPELNNYNAYRTRIEGTDQNNAQMRIMKVLKDNAKIEDYRLDIYQ
ncbi:peptidylprolyl isomerase [Myroides sp. LJL116]